MGAFILVVMMAAAILSDAGRPYQQLDLDRVTPPLPENVAAYENDRRLIALAH